MALQSLLAPPRHHVGHKAQCLHQGLGKFRAVHIKHEKLKHRIRAGNVTSNLDRETPCGLFEQGPPLQIQRIRFDGKGRRGHQNHHEQEGVPPSKNRGGEGRYGQRR